MKPHEAAKSYGLKSLKQGADFHGIHPDTLRAWYTEKPDLFHAACERAAIVLGLAPDYKALLLKFLQANEWRADELDALKKLVEAVGDRDEKAAV